MVLSQEQCGKVAKSIRIDEGLCEEALNFLKNEAGTPICLTRNVMQFTTPKMAVTVSLIDHFAHFEVHIQTLKTRVAQMWKLVNNEVFAGMKKAKETLGYVNNAPIATIVCPAHHATPHPATVEDDGTWMCSVTPQECGVVSDGTILL